MIAPEPERSEFGTLLWKFRTKRNMSMGKLGALAEVDHSYISRLESGSRMPTREVVDSLADSMGVSTAERDQLLVTAGFSTPRSKLTTNIPGLFALDDSYALASPKAQQAVRSTIELLIHYLTLTE